MTEAENIRNVELQGVDMIGFIFYQNLPLSVPDARVSASLRQACRVFVNESKENILDVYRPFQPGLHPAAWQ